MVKDPWSDARLCCWSSPVVISSYLGLIQFPSGLIRFELAGRCKVFVTRFLLCFIGRILVLWLAIVFSGKSAYDQ